MTRGRRALAGMFAVALLVVGMSVNAHAGETPLTAETVGRIEYRSYDLPPLSRAAAIGRAIETRSYTSAPITVWGDLFLPPESAEGPVPAVVIVHGSAGVNDHHRGYARLLADWGIAGFVIDSFGPRGIESTVADQLQLSSATTVIDAYRALDVLVRHPAIDGARVAIMGYSRGAMVAEWAARRWFRDKMAVGGQSFASHVAYYSWCGHQEAKIALTGAPLLFLHGEADDWTPLSLCSLYVERVQAAGYDARLVSYPNAHHAFDYVGFDKTYYPDADNSSGCGYLYDAHGFTTLEGGERYTHAEYSRFQRRCATHGAHLASNPEAREAALAALHTFLTETLGAR